MLRPPPYRRSRAAAERLKSGESLRTVIIALVVNVVIAAAKLISGLISGSTALIAEAAHSLADATNEVLLGISLHRASAPPDTDHPLGHGRERFLWAFLAAIATFLTGGCFSIGIAIHQLTHGEQLGNPLPAAIVLGIAFLGDGASLLQSIRQANAEAKRRGFDLRRHLMRSSDPTVRAIVVEDGAALVGIIIAAAGLWLSHHLGSSTPDAIASLLIGLLMAATALFLGFNLADFLVGKSLPPELLEELRKLMESDKAVREIISLKAVYIGPEETIVAAKIHPAPALKAEELGKAMDELDRKLREASPFVGDVYIDVTSHQANDGDDHA